MRPHGYARYRLNGCRCYVCAFARYEYDRRRNRLILYGQWQPFVPFAEAQAHLHALRALGVGQRRIGELAGLGRKQVRDLDHGIRHDPGRGNPPLTKIRRETAAAILAIPLDPLLGASGARIDARDTWDRVHALVALGYTKMWIAHQLGQSGPGLQLGRQYLSVGNANAVLELYDRIGDTPGPSSRSRREGERNGWLTPFQLEASKLGDVEESEDLDEIAVERIMAGTLVLPARVTPPEMVEAISRLARLGFNDRQIGERVCRSAGAITVLRKRSGIPAGQKAS